MGVVGRSWYGDTSSASDISVAELIGEDLKLVSCELIIIPENMVVRRPTGSLLQINNRF